MHTLFAPRRLAFVWAEVFGIKGKVSMHLLENVHNVTGFGWFVAYS